MSESAYTPKKGSKAEIGVDALRQGPLMLVQLGAAMGCDPSSVPAFLQPALRNGVITKVRDKAGCVHYASTSSLIDEGFTPYEEAEAAGSRKNTPRRSAPPLARNGSAKPEEETESQFGCAIWSDGELQLVRDGETLATLKPSEVEHVRQYLQRMPAIA